MSFFYLLPLLHPTFFFPAPNHVPTASVLVRFGLTGDAGAFAVPELRIYSVFPRPVGPHPVGMFEVNLFTPAQFGAFIPWLVINRGPLSALVHPNTGDDVRDHTQLATWMGQPFPLRVGMLRKFVAMRDEKSKKEAAAGNPS